MQSSDEKLRCIQTLSVLDIEGTTHSNGANGASGASGANFYNQHALYRR